MVEFMKQIALFYVAATTLIETVGFGWAAVEFWPDMILVGAAIAALLICLPINLYAGRVLDRRLREIENAQEGRAGVVERM